MNCLSKIKIFKSISKNEIHDHINSDRFNNIYDTLYRPIAMGHRHSIQSFIYFTGMAEGDAVNLFTSQNWILFHSCSNRCPPLIISFSCHFNHLQFSNFSIFFHCNEVFHVYFASQIKITRYINRFGYEIQIMTHIYRFCLMLIDIFW